MWLMCLHLSRRGRRREAAGITFYHTALVKCRETRSVSAGIVGVLR
jgi:hypothetical protein